MKTRSLSLPISIYLALIATGCTGQNEPHSTTQNEHQRIQEKALTIAMLDDPSTLDPRLERSTPSTTYLRMVYEGLTRADQDGKIQPAIAKTISLSDDLKTYTFHLRDSLWSDGTPVTANDFAETWRSLLSSSFPAPNANQFYMIRGAKNAKENKLPIDSTDIGISASAPDTLIVELEQPCPHFLELLSCHFYFPVHRSIRANPPSAPTNTMNNLISNGPFKFDRYLPRNEVSFVKNPAYWDNSKVHIERITLQILDVNTAMQMYQTGALDWTGSPMGTLPPDAVASLKREGTLRIATGAGTHWFRFNTTQAPFTNEKLRRAFSLAINRQDIVEHIIQGGQSPAMAVVPPSFGLNEKGFFADNDLKAAKALFDQGLQELGIKTSEFPKLSISYASNERNHKIAQAVQQQWNKAFPINIELAGSELQVYLDKVTRGNYQIALGSWYADIHDPINFLEIFSSTTNATNLTGWQNTRYNELIAQSNLEKDTSKRLELLAQAEKILVDAMPVAPIFFNAFNYVHTPKLQGVYLSSLGFIDFKNAKLE